MANAPTVKEPTDVNTGTTVKAGAPDFVHVAQLLKGTHGSEKIQPVAIDGLSEEHASYKSPVRVASTDNIDLGSGSDPGAVDGVTLANNDRILLKDQTTGSQNGIYKCINALIPNTWIRDSDFFASSDIISGLMVVSSEGILGADAIWILTTNGTLILDTTSLVFEESEHHDLPYKKPVRVATTANINDIMIDLIVGIMIDGITLAAGDRVLVKNQTTGSENGIYVIAVSGTPSRTTDFDGGAEVLGAAITVLEGVINKGVRYRLTNITVPVIGTTALVFKDVNDTPNIINVRTPDDLGVLALAPDGVMRVPIIPGITYTIHNDITIPRLLFPTSVPATAFQFVQFNFINTDVNLLCDGDSTPHIWGRNINSIFFNEGNFVDTGNSGAGKVTTLFDIVGVVGGSGFLWTRPGIVNFKRIGSTINMNHTFTAPLFKNNLGGFVIKNVATGGLHHTFSQATLRNTSISMERPALVFQGILDSIIFNNNSVELKPDDGAVELDNQLDSSVEMVGNSYKAIAGNFFEPSKVTAITNQENADIIIDSFETGGAGKTKMVFVAIQDFTIGQKVLIADEAAYDGLQIITAVDDDQKKFTFDVTFSTSGAGTIKMVKHTVASNPYSRDGTVTITDTSNDGTSQILREDDTSFYTPTAFTAGDLIGTATSNPKNEKTIGVKTLSNGAQKDSKAIGCFAAIGNGTATVISTQGVWVNLNLASLAVLTSNNSRWSLENTITGEMKYLDENDIDGVLIASISAASVGGAQEFEFRVVVNGIPTTDNIKASVEIGSDTLAIPLTVPLSVSKNDLVRIQVLNIDGISNIIIKNITSQVA